MKEPKKSDGIYKYVLTLLTAAIISVQFGVFSYADVMIYRDTQKEVAAIAREIEKIQREPQPAPERTHYAGGDRIVIAGEVVQESAPKRQDPAKPVTDAGQSSSQVQPPRKEQAQTPDAPASGAQKEQASSQSASSPPSQSDNGSGSAVNELPGSSNAGGQSNSATQETQASNSSSNADTYDHDFSGGRLLGTIKSNKYHCKDCAGARKIPPENEIWFDSVSDAEAQGYQPCGNCYR